MTVLNRLIAALREADDYNRHDLVEPRVVLWTDGDSLWAPVISLVQEAMPELLVLDSEDQGSRRGPSTVLRYSLTRGKWKETPVIYLPGIPRSAFRGAVGFPESARHLYALQFQGQFWTQISGKDWTPLAFLASGDGGLGLEVARDNSTRDALTAQLENVLRTPVAELMGKRLEAADLHGLATSDTIRSLLQWMAAPESTRREWPAANWRSFCTLAKQGFKLDPEKDGALTAAERLAEGTDPKWNEVWRRYAEAPRSYGGLRQLLERVEPQGLIASHEERLPAVNQAREESLRSALCGLEARPYNEALNQLSELCYQHAPRAKWVWADLDEAPLAAAAFHLGVMANRITAGLPGHDWTSIAGSYTDEGWETDASARRAYSACRDASDTDAVTKALRAVYLRWLETLAERVQAIDGPYPNAGPLEAWTFAPEPGTIIVFVDGLRYDLAAELNLLLQRSGLEPMTEHRWAALPTVTATAKPAWAPLLRALTGAVPTAGFEPSVKETGKPVKAPEFRALLEENGWSWIGPADLGDSSKAGWTETGSFDRHGHDEGARLAWRVEEELKVTASRIRDLLKNGWKKVVVITDHGWLLMPGGLPKVGLPMHLTVSRWGRCALPGPGANHGFKQTPWFWGSEHSVVLAPGIAAFKAGMEYAHGGLTVQEALTPVVTVTAAKASSVRGARIESAKWVGLRLHLELGGSCEGITVDLRTKPADPSSSLLPPGSASRSPDDEGKIAIVVEDDSQIGTAACVVLLRNGELIAKQPVTVGEN